MNRKDFRVIEGGKSHSIRTQVHYPWMECLSSKNALDISVLSEECAEDELEQAKLFLFELTVVVKQKIGVLDLVANPSAEIIQERRSYMQEKRLARDDVDRYQKKLALATSARKCAEKLSNDDTNKFKSVVLTALNLAKHWRTNAFVHIVEDFESVHIGYGNFSGDISDPQLEDFDGYSILYPTGEIHRERWPKIAPPRSIYGKQ